MFTSILPERYRLALRINVRKNRKQRFEIKTAPIFALFGLMILFALLRLLWPDKAGALFGLGAEGIYLLCFLLGLCFALHLFLRFMARRMLTGCASASCAPRYLGRRPFYLIRLTPTLAVELPLAVLAAVCSGTFFSISYVVLAVHTLFCWEDFYLGLKLFTFPSTSLIEEGCEAVKVYVETDEGLLPDEE